MLVGPILGAARTQIRTCLDLSHFPRSVPGNHPVAFVQMLVLAERCLNMDVPYGHGHMGAEAPACGQEPPWQAAALRASALLLLSSPLLPGRLHSVSKDRNGDLGPRIWTEIEKRMELTSTSDTWLYCL